MRCRFAGSDALSVRTYHGVEEPVFYQGVQCGAVTEYSDTLLMFLLKARKPEVYRDRGNDTTVNVQTNVQANIQAAAAIREMIANGELGRLIEGDDQGQRAPAVAGAPPAAHQGQPPGVNDEERRRKLLRMTISALRELDGESAAMSMEPSSLSAEEKAVNALAHPYDEAKLAPENESTPTGCRENS